MKKSEKLKLIILTISIFICVGCTSTTTGGRTYQECYYGDNGEEVCVSKYVPEELDIEPRYGW